jgi:hypothetical protein
MATVNLHSTAISHPKITVLSDGAFRVWIAGLSYCQNHLTDGFIPSQGVYALGVKVSTKLLDELLAERVPGKSSLWHVRSGGYDVHDYLVWNDAAEDVSIRRKNLRERVRKYRNKDRCSNPTSNALRNGHSKHVSNDSIKNTELRPQTTDQDLGAGVADELPNLGGLRRPVHPLEVPGTNPERERANRFLERFAKAHRELRNGAQYVGNAIRDFEPAMALVQHYDDAQLEALIECYMRARGPEFDGKQPTPGRMRSNVGILEEWLRKQGLWPNAA